MLLLRNKTMAVPPHENSVRFRSLSAVHASKRPAVSPAVQKQNRLLPRFLCFQDFLPEGKDFLFAMNGQTGKLVGNLPVSTKRVIGLFAAIAASLIAISVTALLLLAR